MAKKWEYKVVQLPEGDFEGKDQQRLLNSLGEKGWELVAVTNTAATINPTDYGSDPHDYDRAFLYLKREKGNWNDKKNSGDSENDRVADRVDDAGEDDD